MALMWEEKSRKKFALNFVQKFSLAINQWAMCVYTYYTAAKTRQHGKWTRKMIIKMSHVIIRFEFYFKDLLQSQHQIHTPRIIRIRPLSDEAQGARALGHKKHHCWNECLPSNIKLNIYLHLEWEREKKWREQKTLHEYAFPFTNSGTSLLFFPCFSRLRFAVFHFVFAQANKKKSIRISSTEVKSHKIICVVCYKCNEREKKASEERIGWQTESTVCLTCAVVSFWSLFDRFFLISNMNNLHIFATTCCSSSFENRKFSAFAPFDNTRRMRECKNLSACTIDCILLFVTTAAAAATAAYCCCYWI